MQQLKDRFATGASVLGSPLLDVAAAILSYLNAQIQRPQDAKLHRNFALDISAAYGQDESVVLAFTEAWEWLRSNGLICQHPSHGENWITLTRKGREVARDCDLEVWAAEQQFPEDLLHPRLRSVCLRLYRQGLYDTSVFEAFKTLEVAIRSASSLGDDLVGTKLAARAFNPENGELTRMETEAGERQALMNLMSGALGSYKNPQSHRHVGVDAFEAREMLIMASHLIRIVESRLKS